MKTGTKQRIFWIAMALMVMAAIFLFSMQSTNKSENLSDSVAHVLKIEQQEPTVRASNQPLVAGLTLRKLAHVFVYGVLSFCMTGALQGVRGRITLAVSGSFLYGVLDEVHQHLQGRYGRFEDTLIDLIGIVLGVILFFLLAAAGHTLHRKGIRIPGVPDCVWDIPGRQNGQPLRVAYIFDLDLEADARAQKEIISLRKAGHEVLVLEWNKDAVYRLTRRTVTLRNQTFPIDTLGIPVRRTEGIRSNLGALLKYERSLLRWLQKNRSKYDIIHCVNLPAAFAGRFMLVFFRKPFVYDVFDDYADAHQCEGRLYRWIKKLDYRIMKRAKTVILCSEKRREQITGPVDHIEILYNVPDIPISEIQRSSRTREPGTSRSFTVVYAGNLTAYRMIPELLETQKAHPEWHLEIGGDGPLGDLVREYAKTCPNIRYHEKIPYEEVLRLEQEGDVVPALYDPSLRNNIYAAPNKVFEAMCLGKPTVMVRNTGVDDLVEQERTGLVIGRSLQELERALKEIADTLPAWRAEAPRMQALFRENYSWEKMERRLLRIYES